MEIFKYKTDPLKKDSDDDMLSDYDEITLHKTDPLLADTDGDKLRDGDEINKYKTDPLNRDTDGDGIDDSGEIYVYKTDPLNKDTDRGSVDDGTEVRRGTNPLDADDDIMKIGKPVILKGITFDFNSAAIKLSSEETLSEALRTLRENPEIVIEISGHADEIGSEEYNIELSQKRADAVKEWLTLRGIDKSRITAKGYGKKLPVAPNDTPKNRKLNRRIEFKRIK
jgi:outer membrane protein OmpA-like peptidoglycan-associated protein